MYAHGTLRQYYPVHAAATDRDLARARCDVFFNIGALRCDDGAKQIAACLFHLARLKLDGLACQQAA